jgi:hypothetical protein
MSDHLHEIEAAQQATICVVAGAYLLGPAVCG